MKKTRRKRPGLLGLRSSRRTVLVGVKKKKRKRKKTDVRDGYTRLNENPNSKVELPQLRRLIRSELNFQEVVIASRLLRTTRGIVEKRAYPQNSQHNIAVEPEVEGEAKALNQRRIVLIQS
ncbi:hypothetical protein HN011_003487 [Eciton burchellii]|nr:hypothetical protein HN011_003487 [Eciton burchellii]